MKAFIIDRYKDGGRLGDVAALFHERGAEIAQHDAFNAGTSAYCCKRGFERCLREKKII
jgi:hypothetical protein